MKKLSSVILILLILSQVSVFNVLASENSIEQTRNNFHNTISNKGDKITEKIKVVLMNKSEATQNKILSQISNLTNKSLVACIKKVPGYAKAEQEADGDPINPPGYFNWQRNRNLPSEDRDTKIYDWVIDHLENYVNNDEFWKLQSSGFINECLTAGIANNVLKKLRIYFGDIRTSNNAYPTFVNSFEQVGFIKFTNEELDANKKAYTDEVALSSSLGFQHNEKTFTFPSLKSNKEIRDQLQKYLDDYSNAMKGKSQLRCYIQSVPMNRINDGSLVIGSVKSNYAVNVRNSFKPVDLKGALADSLTNSYMKGDMGYKIEQKKKQELALLMTTIAMNGLNEDGDKETRAYAMKIGASSEIQLVPTSFPSIDIYAKNSVFSTTDKARKFTTLTSNQLVLDNTSPFKFISLVNETTGEPNNLSVLACDYASNKAFVPVIVGEAKEVLATSQDVIGKLENSCQALHDKINPNWTSVGYVNDYLNGQLSDIWNLDYGKTENIAVLYSGRLKDEIYQKKRSELDVILEKSNITSYCEYTPNPCNSKYIGTKHTISSLDLWERGGPSSKEIDLMNISYKFSIGEKETDNHFYGFNCRKSLMGNKSCIVEVSSNDGKINKKFTVYGFVDIPMYKEDNGKRTVSELKY
ncbi:MAG: hypothetical protein PHQ95_03430 [Candidatus Gracilibacteria bacterium]|nr:hypothetical protein [Candidatus Gracilibacteria bacterium]